ncbi:U-box domain-containing protein 6-like isoform X2 [Phoenix dactylifera]|uniref:RING-type E3 ubiquitin transferase n=1 Tax=Phoenix dactylifera TaxID=42345 RepID=A0A8B7MV45_PHODC|nr:U-box domain-containing protein 6-like isoform X2 [Phoenix dactylifera]
MDSVEVEENLFAPGDAKLHGGMCKQLSAIVYKVLGIFPLLEDARPRSKPGLQALCSLHVALNKAKSLLLHCSDCSKIYLIMEIVAQLEGTVFTLDPSEKQVGEEVITLLQKEKQFNGDSNDGIELEVFHQAALKLGITSSRAALTERRALKKLIEKACAEEDNRKESIVAYLLHLMRKYSKLFRSVTPDDTDSQQSAPCSPTILGSLDGVNGNNQAFERQLTKLSSFDFKHNWVKSGNMPIPPEEFRCPISLQLMYDPVIISSGQTYERICIENWFNGGHGTCPKTQQQLSHLSLTPNYCVKGLIASWCEQNGVPIPDGPPESLDLNYWRLALSDQDAMNSRSTGTIDSCQTKCVKVVPLEENAAIEKLKVDERGSLENGPFEDHEMDELERYESLLAVLNEGNDIGKQHKAVEQIRFLLKDDEEARIYMGVNGFVEALVQFLKSAICEGDARAQEVGALALFNLAVNNNRNKTMLLSAGAAPLLEEMIQNSETWEASAALYLNLSCLDEAKPVIGSSQAVPFLIQLLEANNSRSHSCKHDALYTLFNLSAHPPNIPHLLTSGIIEQLQSFLAAPAGPSGYTWVEKALAIFINLAASNTAARKHIISTPGLIGSIAAVLDNGEPAEQEQAVSCLLILCSDSEEWSYLVLQEGVIPALVLVTANGTPRGKEKAQKLLKLFREQRQREVSPARTQLHEVVTVGVGGCADGGGYKDVSKATSYCKSRSKRFGRAWTSMTSMWKYKNRSRHQY